MKKGTIWMGTGLLFMIVALFLTVYNIWDQKRAGEESAQIMSQLEEFLPYDIIEAESDETKFYEKYPDVQMPTQVVAGNRYIGILEIPAFGLEMPIMDNCEEASIRTAPGLYAGSVYKGDMILAGHNYQRHFGKIGELLLGDQLKFTDMDGHAFVYEVVEKEVLPETAVEEMLQGEWDMTLYTCDYSGRSRITVRCVLVD